MRSPLLPDLPASVPSVICSIACIAAVIFVIIKLFQRTKLGAVPTVGSSSWFALRWAGLRHSANAHDVIQEGYERHKPAPFKVAQLHGWMVVLSSREHVEELRRVPDDTLSFEAAKNDRHAVEYTMGPQLRHNPYHIPIVRSRLTRNIGVLYSGIRNEITVGFDDVLDLTGNEWKSVPALKSVQKVVCRASNRMFVGLPLCRDPDWIELNIQYTLDVVSGGRTVGLFPKLLKPLAARFLTNVNRSNQRARRLLGPIIEERQKYLNEYGNAWPDKPNDFLSWLMEEAEGRELTLESLTARILVINIASIHTSSHSFTHVLFRLAANPRYIKPLREEVEAIVEKEGWSKATLGKMRKVDSFIKECQRLEGTGIVTMARKALKDFTFSDGTFIPKGTMPFRFADLREEDGESVKHQFVSTTTEYLPFGHGRHACPGRFFVAYELKSMLAHIVLMYDVKLPDNATRPQARLVGTSRVPDPSARVMFRRRVD